jgi:hypothetical protein
MEFVKVAFVIAGTATLDKLLTARNLTAFIGFSGACIGALSYAGSGHIGDLFRSFLVIAFMRSGDVRTIALISAGQLLVLFRCIVLPISLTALRHGDMSGNMRYHRITSRPGR